jgi:TonB family protein
VEEVRGVVGGVPGGIATGVRGGVLGGIIGSVPVANAPPQQFNSMQPARISTIRVLGLPGQAAAELLASLPVHEGDEITNDAMQRTTRAVAAYDEHLTSRWMHEVSSSGPRVSLTIAPPGVSPVVPPAAPQLATADPNRIKVGGEVQGAMIVSKTPPIYPELAKQARVSGVVHLSAIIGPTGEVQELHALGGPALLIQAAMDAVKQWVYRPTLLNGSPVSVETTIDVNFTLAQ